MRVLALREVAALTALCGLIFAAGCGGGGGGEDDGGSSNPPPVSSNPPPPVTPPPPTDPAPDDPPPPPAEPPPPAHKNLFNPVSDTEWDETAVRKVLHTFAYGGQATDAQITVWAGMAPEFAIEEMLTFEEHNLKLSTPVYSDTDGLANRSASLRELAAFWSSDDPANGVAPERRVQYHIENQNGSLPLLWTRATLSRGLNPFRHKIGFWETNYHMAVNNFSGVSRLPMLRYYDDIIEAHAQGLPYQKVIGVAASSAAVALQYGHRSNRFRNGVCDCNEDFAREYHQLFFGVLGSNDPDYHETVTIKNTAKAFTDMPVYFDDVSGIADFVDFGTYYHPDEPLEILGTMINGTNAAERIDEMIEVSINHPESLDNLPVIIVSDLADDNLDTRKKSAIRNAWRGLDQKNLLTFLRGYAISTIFHDSSRVKHLNSVDRNLLVSNLVGLSNREHYLNLYQPNNFFEDVQIFVPTHDVFGTQTGEEAASSDLVFRKNYGYSTENVWRIITTEGTRYGQNWEKDWSSIVPRTGNGYIVVNVAEWLWQRFIADGLKYFGPLERAHVYALLGSDRDLNYLLNDNDLDRVIGIDDVLLDPELVLLVNELVGNEIDLDSTSDLDRSSANRRIGMAINFIVGTPFIFAQEGR